MKLIIIGNPTEFTFPARDTSHSTWQIRRIIDTHLQQSSITFVETAVSKILIKVQLLATPRPYQPTILNSFNVIAIASLRTEGNEILPKKPIWKSEKFPAESKAFRIQNDVEIIFDVNAENDYKCNTLIFYADPVGHDVTLSFSCFK